MDRAGLRNILLGIISAAVLGMQLTAADRVSDEAACRALLALPTLTVISAGLVDAKGPVPQYCYVKGTIPPGITYHIQLPLQKNWNGRYLNWGDGGKDGDLDFANHRIAQGYAVSNSNMGHDDGVEPGASFGYNNRQSEIDFGHRAVHLTVNAAKTIVNSYYGKEPEYSYHEGCSTGGREGLMEAQRYSYDFDGIVAGDPVNFYQQNNVSHVFTLQNVYKNQFAGALAYDTDGDGRLDSLTKVSMVKDAVLAKCDTLDGIKDGVIDDPEQCHFDPDADLAGIMCPGDVNSDQCLTQAQLKTIRDIYRGPYDSRGASIYEGKSFCSEFVWADRWIPHPGNSFYPTMLANSGDHLNYLFYEEDPGVPMPDLGDLSQIPNASRNPPEWAWWQFDFDDYTRGKGDFMKGITDATDPDLTRFLIENKGKLILYHGWCDGGPSPLATVHYYQNVVEKTYGGNIDEARQSARLFMVPGMRHCQGGPGPNSWDKLADLVEWVEHGKAPDYVIATHSTDGRVDNERPVCAYPQRAVYTGPAGGENDPANWLAKNFTCR